MTTAKGLTAPLLQVGDRVRVNARSALTVGVSATNGLKGHSVMTTTMSQPTGRVTKVINRGRYQIELDEPLLAYFPVAALEKI